jgi:sRNA-binding regulator protein Hfq
MGVLYSWDMYSTWVLGLLPLGRVEGWDLHNVLIDNDSHADIIFLHAYDHMGINHSML